MRLRFFADHCVPALVVRLLRDADHEVFVIKEHIPPNSGDSMVIAKAQEMDAILVSLNGDFSDIVTYPPSAYRGIVSLQVRNHPRSDTGLDGSAACVLLGLSRNEPLPGQVAAGGNSSHPGSSMTI